MDNQLYNSTLVICLLVGATQLIGGSIRLSLAKHTSQYSKGLNKYFAFVITYILSYIAITFIHNTWIKVDNLLIVFMPVLPLCIAVYYWIVIYTYSKSDAS